MDKHDCKNCSRPIEKKSYESSNRYASRKFCSQSCSKEYMKTNKIGWFGAPKVTWEYTNKFAGIDRQWAGKGLFADGKI